MSEQASKRWAGVTLMVIFAMLVVGAFTGLPSRVSILLGAIWVILLWVEVGDRPFLKTGVISFLFFAGMVILLAFSVALIAYWMMPEVVAALGG